ncbi:alpha/beta-hydrolase [Meredithblackwellia eburnea MCA 4105]
MVSQSKITTNTVNADDIDIFYRSAGPETAPVFLLLHGFPTSSLSYRHLLAGLSDKYRVIAPDLPGFGFTNVPAERAYKYTFANLAKTVEAFVDALNLTKYALYVFDYGAPTGFRLALSRPEAVTAIVSQNGNAFVEGLGDFWDLIRPLWKDPSPENRAKLQFLTSFDVTKSQYVDGEANPGAVPPESYWLDYALLQRPGNIEIQLDLFYDYRTNVDLYPEFHAYLAKYQPPVLAIWGKNDAIFIPPGAEAFKTVVKDAEVKLIDGGHFVLENHHEEVVDEIRAFFERKRI